ncbi:MAG: tetraacyldisaccharide 4'-kinase, partial [Gemmatimonadaceae bacterium]
MLVERVWHADGAAPAFTRGLLTPFAWLFAAGVRVRNALYDRGVLPSSAADIPVLSIGNLSVGGTGKTPLAAYLAMLLRKEGAAPALVMRGVGGDESRAYEVLAPGVPVIVDADRVRGVQHAARRGAGVAVLDDAFQHRRLRRDEDVVVLSADRNDSAARLLPAGPQREPLESLRRASLAVIVRKAAGGDAAANLRERVKRLFPHLAIAEIALVPASLVAWNRGVERSLASLREQRIIAVAAIGDPTAFVRQLEQYTQQLKPIMYRDHHAYTERDAVAIAACADGFDAVVCTLKDVVKLGPIWPRQAPDLWYVSQRLEVEEGESEIQRMLA